MFLYFIKESVQFRNKSISRINGGWIHANFKFEWRILIHWTFDEKSLIVMITKRNRYANEVQMSKFQCRAYSVQIRIITNLLDSPLIIANAEHWCWEDIGLKNVKKKKERKQKYYCHNNHNYYNYYATNVQKSQKTEKATEKKK